MQEKDRDVTRFLWLRDIVRPVITGNIAVFRLTRIPLGMISSQFLIAITIATILWRKRH